MKPTINFPAGSLWEYVPIELHVLQQFGGEMTEVTAADLFRGLLLNCIVVVVPTTQHQPCGE